MSQEALIESRLQSLPVVALIQAEDTAVAVATARALVAGGLTVLEVVMRTEAALDCVRAVKAEVEGAVVGAGTVLNAAHVNAAAEAGAGFIVSPGLSEAVVKTALGLGLPVYPGIATASELQSAWNMGLGTVKFFPASLAGGIPMIKALASVFRSMKFMPTGGISADNLAEYLAVPQVVACGGSWLTPAAAIRAGDY
ncbi:MAG TPA: bifunctional 4-hydroxy-2-oxoglutarate aldolase/2-dehydro-3-deoxy-phosphogluconate aldolase, partial [Xanthomonadales bacterium]|nr:bifunctional 4-hydroxy-2-oxoglutarate aldolase/2-dehydro-3-deoxy-phosphogluconate aldolase [Xanthomonadales bacterium]